MKPLFQLLSRWPLPLLHFLGAGIGWLTFLLSPTWRRRFLQNARQAGYSFAPVRKAVAESGKLLAETPRMWFGATPAVHWELAEQIAGLRAERRGIVFLTPHLGCFEAAGLYIAQRMPLTVMYRPPKLEWLEPLMIAGRALAGEACPGQPARRAPALQGAEGRRGRRVAA